MNLKIFDFLTGFWSNLRGITFSILKINPDFLGQLQLQGDTHPNQLFYIAYLYLMAFLYVNLRCIASVSSYLTLSGDFKVVAFNYASLSALIFSGYLVRNKIISFQSGGAWIIIHALFSAWVRLPSDFLRSSFSILPMLPGISYVVVGKKFGFGMGLLVSVCYTLLFWSSIGRIETRAISVEEDIGLYFNIVLSTFMWGGITFLLLKERDDYLNGNYLFF